ncbi:M15 family metallopeptidase [Ruegeria sp.]|uniref:M15 family metallopeptidase n=1 Tax=Ruegeria sp. TaxID=1879320 RepID=UPI003C7DDD74
MKRDETKEAIQQVRGAGGDEEGLAQQEGKEAEQGGFVQGHEEGVEVMGRAKKFRFGKRSEDCFEAVHPDLVRVARRALEMSSHDFGIHCGLRSIEEQKILVKTGKSLTMDSRHVTGHALDAHPWIDGDIPWNDWRAWQRMATTWKRAADDLGIPLEWGGDWARFVDGPHFQLPREWYPD